MTGLPRDAVDIVISGRIFTMYMRRRRFRQRRHCSEPSLGGRRF